MIWLALIFVVAGLASPIYTLADLGTLGGSSAMAAGLNAFGQAAGTLTSASGFAYAIGFPGSGMTNLGAGQANGINDAGVIAGTEEIGGQTYATVWSNGVASPVAGAGSYAMAINNSGSVAGMLIDNGEGSAFVSQNGTVVDLGTFSGGSWSAAYGLNDEGQAAGYGMTASGNFRAFVWTPGEGYAALGTLGGANSYAMAINNSGMAAGSSQVASGYVHAFASTGSSMQDLGTLGGSSSYAYGINNFGNVVGYSLTGSNRQAGFLEEGGMMYDINALLIDAPGWDVTGLYAINGSNQVVGVGILDGVEHAVLLTDPPPTVETAVLGTPEPSGWVLCGGGVAVLLWLRKRCLQR